MPISVLSLSKFQCLGGFRRLSGTMSVLASSSPEMLGLLKTVNKDFMISLNTWLTENSKQGFHDLPKHLAY